MHESTRVDVEDGTQLDLYVARPAGPGPHPGLMVLQEIFGVNGHIRDVCQRWAAQGYLVVAPDMFHRVAGPGYQAGYEDFGPSIALATKVRGEDVALDLKACYAHLRGRPDVRADRIGALGFCMGGAMAFRANGTLPLQAAVSYYGSAIIGPDLVRLAERVSGPQLFFWAGQDGYIPTDKHRAAVDELRKHRKPFVDVEFSYADHGFFCDARSNYHKDAAAQSFALAAAFLRDHLQGA